MPPTTRRTGTGSRSSSSTQPHQHQQTLNFRTASKVTKPAATAAHTLPGKHTLEAKSKIKSEQHDEDFVGKLVKEVTVEPSQVVKEEGEEEVSTPTRKQEVATPLTPEPESEQLQQLEQKVDSAPLTALSPPSTPELPLSSPSLTHNLPPDILPHLHSLTPTKIQKYHTSTILPPTSRLVHPVHQSNLSREEQVLRHFDMTSKFGPCVGISRVNRWVRAWRLGLQPPIEVLGVLVGVGSGEGEAVEGEKKAKGRGGKKEKEGMGVVGVLERGGRKEGKRDERMAFLDEELSTRNAKE